MARSQQDIRAWHGAHADRRLVCIQGLGFVGAAMAVVVASAVDAAGRPLFDVVGVDLDTEHGRERIAALNRGEFPFATTDAQLMAGVREASRRDNLLATSDSAAYGLAAVILVDVNFDIEMRAGRPEFALRAFLAAIAAIAQNMREDALVIVETTVPPGTCARIVAPEIVKVLEGRGLRTDRFRLAHAYERVMPGASYFDSIKNFWRVYAGHTPEAADACAEFLSSVVDVERYPLQRLGSTTASETAKVLENSYRAVTIALMQEWGRFAEAANIDLFEVVSAIRVRPTHSNMRTPGLGVGGYCLTKDPLFADIAARLLFDRPDLSFPFCRRAVEVNAAMPLDSVARLRGLLGGSLNGRRILVLGVSYRPGVADTRHSPSQLLVEALREERATVLLHDPLVGYWQELDEAVPRELPSSQGIDALVLAVAHDEYTDFDFVRWLEERRPVVLDTNGVLSVEQRRALRTADCRVASIGRGDAW